MEELTNQQALSELYKAASMAPLTKYQHDNLNKLAAQLQKLIKENELELSAAEPELEKVD